MAILNREHLEEMTGGDITVDAELYQVFIDTTDDYLEKIKNAQSYDDKKSATHSLKGASANMGAEDLSAACKKAEEEIEGDWENAALEVFRLYKETIQQMIDIIQQAKDA